jgi:hypothetical protein
MRYLKIMGIYHWRNNTGAVQVRPGEWLSFGKKGSADIIGLLPPDGKFLAIETKAPDGRLSPEQREFLEAIKQQGGLAVVVRGWKELDRALREAGLIDDGPLFTMRD